MLYYILQYQVRGCLVSTKILKIIIVWYVWFVAILLLGSRRLCRIVSKICFKCLQHFISRKWHVGQEVQVSTDPLEFARESHEFTWDRSWLSIAIIFVKNRPVEGFLTSPKKLTWHRLLLTRNPDYSNPTGSVSIKGSVKFSSQ